MQPLPRVAAALGVPAALMTSAAALGWGTSGAVAAVTAPGAAAFDDLLALVAAGVAWAVLAWLTAGLLLCLAAEARRHGRSPRPGRAGRLAAGRPPAGRAAARSRPGGGAPGPGHAGPGRPRRRRGRAAGRPDPAPRRRAGTRPVDPGPARCPGGRVGPARRAARATGHPAAPGPRGQRPRRRTTGRHPLGHRRPRPRARTPRSPTSRRAGPAGTPPTDRPSAPTPT